MKMYRPSPFPPLISFLVLVHCSWLFCCRDLLFHYVSILFVLCRIFVFVLQALPSLFLQFIHARYFLSLPLFLSLSSVW